MIPECLVEDPATGLHRPRDYVRSLENQAIHLEARIAYLETFLRESRPEVATDHFGNNISIPNAQMALLTPAGFRGRALPLIESSINPEQTSSVEAPGADLLRDEVALLCLGAAGREPQYFGPSSALSFSRIAGTVMSLTTIQQRP
jgi:hypothetical protein